MSDVRENFRLIRESMNMTQSQLASYLGIDQSMLSKFEKGERELNLHHIEKACLLFGCFIDDLESDNATQRLKLSFRAKDIQMVHLDDVAAINQIALNLLEMKALTHEE